jgi:hypothetical protein
MSKWIAIIHILAKYQVHTITLWVRAVANKGDKRIRVDMGILG